MSTAYIETIQRIERLHRQFLETIKDELDRLGIRDLNAVQAMILFNLGGEQMTVGDLTHRGCYQGSNVSYNVKKLVELGYLTQQRADHDRRATYLACTTKGHEIRGHIQQLMDANAAEAASLSVDVEAAADSLGGIERALATARMNQHAASRRVA
ncbi:hypothetical protein CKO28_06150 [Rhodovibrio sodomensis]|uniref:HTH marR-type domain-containing protein n=1 Tax=Rhodovibrio sodomensis TaxID=1088 RepID=A0ABS1DAY5_9PROT|nr:MarR family transcriptional regulator [Rhodovibrio sodomensis]MBK1667614.1 hypothetical protein [Rhodovibrio sodomensis]